MKSLRAVMLSILVAGLFICSLWLLPDDTDYGQPANIPKVSDLILPAPNSITLKADAIGQLAMPIRVMIVMYPADGEPTLTEADIAAGVWLVPSSVYSLPIGDIYAE